MTAPQALASPDVAETRRRSPPFCVIASAALGYFFAAAFSIYLTGLVANLASFWAATGILVVVLIRRPRCEWPALLAVLWLADFFSAYLLGSPPLLAAGVATAAVAEGLLAAILICRFASFEDLLDTRFLVISLLSLVIAALMAATLGAGWLHLLEVASFWDTWAVWFNADLLGTIIVGAALLIWTDRSFVKRRGRRFWIEVAVWSGSAAIGSYLVFTQQQPFLFFVLPPVLLSTFRTGLFGATSGALVVALISLWLTLRGQGPIVAADFGVEGSIQAIQAFVGVVFVSTFPLAVILERDKKLKGELRTAKDLAIAARATAEEAAGAKGDFLASMSHEIRTPLNSIIGFTDLLLEDESLDERQRRQIGVVHKSGNALLAVVDDVLDFSKIEAGKVDIHPQPFPIGDLLDRMASITRNFAEAKGLHLSVAQDPNLAKCYLGDEQRLQQVLLNLLNNAIKFTDSGKVALSVSVERSTVRADTILFSIEDTGEGVSDDKQHRLFHSFSQADGTIAKRHGGTGLGLAISKRLVEAMGGTIGVRSKEGKGSTFWFKVKLAQAELPSAPHAPAAPAVATRSARILLVEDVALNRELACAILRNDGHQIDTADDGEEAVKAARQGGYDLILMDIQMPKVDGIAATKMIRALPGPAGTVQIIAMTANVLPDQVEHFLAAGMDDHVGKPIKQAELKAAINRALRLAPDLSQPQAAEGNSVAMMSPELSPRPK